MGEMLKLKYRFHLQKVGRQYVAITVGDDVKAFDEVLYFNETGAFICEHLQQGATKASLLDALKKEYDAPEELLSECLEALLLVLDGDGVLTSLSAY